MGLRSLSFSHVLQSKKLINFTLSDCAQPSKDKTNQECYYFISKLRSTKDTSPAIANPSVTAVLVVIAAVVSVTVTYYAISHLNTRASWVELSH